jgi:hypothetical protein
MCYNLINNLENLTMTIKNIDLNSTRLECIIEEISPKIDRMNSLAKKFFAASAFLGLASIPLGICLPPVAIITGTVASVFLIAAAICKAYAFFLSSQKDSFEQNLFN